MNESFQVLIYCTSHHSLGKTEKKALENLSRCSLLGKDLPAAESKYLVSDHVAVSNKYRKLFQTESLVLPSVQLRGRTPTITKLPHNMNQMTTREKIANGN